MSDHVFGNRSLRDLDVQLHQLTVDPRCAPGRILAAHRSNQIACFFWNLRTSSLPVTNFPGPIPTESLTMPGDDCFRLQHEQCGTPGGPHYGQPNPQASVNWFED